MLKSQVRTGLAGLLFSLATVAHEPAVSGYRVAELAVPQSLQTGCLSGYSQTASIGRINDFGVASGTFTCNTVVDPTVPALRIQSGAFVAAPWFGAVELPQSAPGFAYAYDINNRGELFGYESPADTGGLFATKWSLAGGRERIFFDPTCESIQFTAAVDGNAHYTIGWGFRTDASLPIPFDTLCLTTRWLIRTPAGVEIPGPLFGSPASLNASDVAVGTVNRSAVRYHVPTGQLRVLHPADAGHSVEAVYINDLGEAAGRITRNSVADTFNQCDPGTAVRWERDGRERVLPHLPGAVSSHAFGVGYDGETVGDSGAGAYCVYTDNSQERAVLWRAGRAYDLNTLIPRGAGITLTYAYSMNRRGQITASGFTNAEPLTLCPRYEFDPVNGTASIASVPCHNTHMYVLTPAGR